MRLSSNRTIVVNLACLQLFSPSRRLRLQGLPGLAMEAAKTIEGYAKLILPRIPRDIEDMAPGEGFVGQKGLCKVSFSLSRPCFKTKVLPGRRMFA